MPEPLELTEPVVNYEFIRMPDSTGFGDYTESGQVIPVSYQGQPGSFTHQMFLNDHPPIAGGRELWGFPKKLAQPKLAVEIDTLVGTLNYGSVRIATGTMGYKHRALDIAVEARKLAAPNFLLKIIPHVDGTPRICELVRYHLEDITVKGAWTGPAALDLYSHALAPVAELPVLQVLSAKHIVADLTLGLGTVVHDYLSPSASRPTTRDRLRDLDRSERRLIGSAATSGVWKMLNVMREQISPVPQQIKPLPYDVVALVLQGGGALGAYQAGVYEGLHEAGIRPNWLAGISIGALNAAIIAGSPEAERVGRLREFWETICACPMEWPAGEGLADALPFAFDLRSLHNAMAATRALFQGQPGFFKPRFPSPLWSPFSGDAATSFYDTAPLQQTLERLVDFDRLNSGEVRVSVGAVNVRTGNLTYFDTAERRLGPKHFMASGALPPGFPAVEIEGEHYWDGGVVSNTPLSRVLSSEPCDTLTFQIDLWSARGRVPHDMMEVSSRQKDIQYSSRTRAITDHAMRMQKMRQALQRTIERLPESAKQDPEIRAIADMARHRSYNIIHLIYQSKIYEGHSKDYEFGLSAMRAHWQSGLDDIRRTLADPRRLDPPAPELGIVTHDVHRRD